MSKSYGLTALLFLLAFSPLAIAKNSTSHISWDGYVRLEGTSNVHGGIKTGTIFNATALLIAIYDKDYQIGITGATHTQRENLYTGSIQHTSSLNVQREVRLARLNYKHEFTNHLEGYIGVVDMEDFYDITETAVYLRNSAFVNAMALDKVTQLASFPYPGFGAMLRYAQNNSYFLLGLYQGNPQHLSSVFQHGYMLITEVGNNIPLERSQRVNLSLKGGAWIYRVNSIPGFTNAEGLYFISQITSKYRHHVVDGFMQLAYSNEKPKYVPYSLTLGTRVNNIFLKSNTDWISFGIGKVWLPNLPSEVVYEFNYTYKFCKDFYLIPDVQYIVHPSGVHPNATVFLLRLNYRR